MADTAHRLTDEKLEEMEKRLSAIYSRAGKEIGERWKEYLIESQTEIDDLQKAYDLAKQGGDKKEIRKAGRKLSTAKRDRTLMNNRFKDLTERTAAELANVNRTALAYVNGKLPEVYSINYNALASTVDGVGGYSFALVDADTVRNLATTDESLLPYKQLDEKKDIRWNVKKMNSEVLQGILQGEPMGRIASRLSKVIGMDETAAIRNARTMVTGAENKGRQDSYARAEADGIILQKEWVSTNDGRTRHSHAVLDGAIVDQDKKFDNGLMYPGDPSGRPEEVYNCRCTLVAKVNGFKKTQVQKAMAEKQKPIPVSDKMAETFKDYSNGKYGYYCEYSQALVSKSGQELKDAIEYVDKYSGSGWYIQDMGINEAKRRAREMMDIIDSQPKTQTPLYRIDRWNFDKKEGDIIEWGIHSTSRDAGFADRVLSGNEEGFLDYAEKLKSRPVVFEIVGEKKHLDISKYSSFEQQESLVFGKFRIKSITEPDLSLSIRKQGFDDAVKDFPENFEFFTSKKGKEMVRFADGKTFTIEQARQRTFYNGTYGDWSVILKYEEEERELATRPRKVQIEQIFE